MLLLLLILVLLILLFCAVVMVFPSTFCPFSLSLPLLLLVRLFLMLLKRLFEVKHRHSGYHRQRNGFCPAKGAVLIFYVFASFTVGYTC